MKKAFFSIVLSLFFASAFARPNAIDFTASDVDGVEHHLFSYLDAGKYVMLKFTSTT